MAYLISLFGLLSYLVWQVGQGVTSIASALGLVVAYIHSTKSVVNIANPFRKYMRGWAFVKDLFDTIALFGKQGYPVLGTATDSLVRYDSITIHAHNICFDYDTADADLFNNHTFTLHCSRAQKNKLYGIIGASGSGKTTFVSILGGQLKPIHGTVTIDTIDIYSVNDAVRRQLIALQGQVATNVRGTVKYNLLFGLPEHHGYTDQYLLKILERVGILHVLSAHEGLNTMLGEGGLNFSGGQRQRLNFAGLYLRACYYNPVLILIDEPTSSLDELSEAAITEMIVELAHTTITLVITHRLKTVKEAVGLIDLSLLATEKEITAHTPEELKIKSKYYSQLIHNHLD
jgi:ABC-type multidrug transport system fused ATPase/permease subunit